MFSKRFVGFVLAFLLLIVFAFVGVYSAAAQPSGQDSCSFTMDQTDMAAEAFAAGQYADAIAAYQCLLAVDYHDPHMILALADAYLLDGQFLAATSTYSAALDRDMALLTAESLETAETERRDLAVETAPDDVNAHLLRGVWLWALAQDGAALSDYQAVLEIEPDHVGALTFQGSSKAYLGDMRGADEAWDRARELGSSSPHVFALIAYTMLGVGNPEAAFPDIMRSLELAPDDLYVLSVQARYFDIIGSWENEIAVLEEIVPRALPMMWRIPLRLGRAYLQNGDVEAAEAQFAELQAREPDNPWINYEIAFAYDGIDALASADHMYQSAQQFGINPGDTTSITIDEPLSLEMTFRRGYRLAFEAETGQTLTLTALADDTLDPLIVLVDPEGVAIAFSDDIDGMEDLTAQIRDWVVPADGTYTLFVTHAGLGSEGTTEVSITTR